MENPFLTPNQCPQKNAQTAKNCQVLFRTTLSCSNYSNRIYYLIVFVMNITIYCNVEYTNMKIKRYAKNLRRVCQST